MKIFLVGHALSYWVFSAAYIDSGCNIETFPWAAFWMDPQDAHLVAGDTEEISINDNQSAFWLGRLLRFLGRECEPDHGRDDDDEYEG
jgi:hypothetical protein